MMHYKTIMANLLTIVCLLVEPITSLVKPKASLAAYISIRETPWTVTSSKPVIYTSLSILLSFVNMLRSNRYWWSTVLSYIVNSASQCGRRKRTGKMKRKASRNCFSIVDPIKGRYIIWQGHTIRWKRMVESILSKSFQEFSDTHQFFIVVSLNPTIKQFPKISNSHYHSNCPT